jgi:hypothetical protein
MMRQTDLPLCF